MDWSNPIRTVAESGQFREVESPIKFQLSQMAERVIPSRHIDHVEAQDRGLHARGGDELARSPRGRQGLPPKTPRRAPLTLLPTNLWLIGLGHLGQAYLWALGLLPFTNPEEVRLVLQDVDIITPSTESTSILTDASMVKHKKTRVMATWAERRGFTTAIHQRLFDASFRRQEDEPTVALYGLAGSYPT